MDEILASFAKPPPVYACLGDQGVLVSEAVSAIRKALAGGPMAAFNHAVFTPGEEGVAGLRDALRQVPVMAPCRLVELRQAESADKRTLEAILEFAQSPIDTTVLLVSGEKMPAASDGADLGTRFLNAAKKVGVVCKFEARSVDPVAFARARCAPWRAKLGQPAFQKLVELGGEDLDTLAGNVERCAGYVGEGGEITPEVVELVCASTADADVWKLTDAIVERNRDMALSELHRLLEDGEPPHKLLASVAYQLRQVLLLQDATRRKLNEKEAGVRIPPFKIRAVRAAIEARPVSPSTWLEELAVANRRMNSFRAGDRRVLEAFVMRLVVR